jgi:TrpR-related protein YerC/YecD
MRIFRETEILQKNVESFVIHLKKVVNLCIIKVHRYPVVKQRGALMFVNDKMKEMHLEELFRVILSLKTEEEVAAFFEDICTIKEIKAMLQRLQVAQLLDRGEQYKQIVAKTGASSATISRVNRCLQYGSDGYRLVLDRMKQDGVGE